MKRYHNLVLILALTFIFVAVAATSAFAEVVAFVAEDNGVCYQYNYSGLQASYSLWQKNQSDVKGNLYKHFTTVAENTKAIINSQRQYVSYENVQAAFSTAQKKGETLDVKSYVETAPLYTMPAIVTVVTMDEQFNIVKTIVNLTTGPTAWDFKLTGGEGVAEVIGTAEEGNAITFVVDTNATYTGASVTLSDDVWVTVTGPGITERSPVNVLKGDLKADTTLLKRFDLKDKTSATGDELIAKTQNELIQVVLESQAPDKTQTTYTLKFVAKITP